MNGNNEFFLGYVSSSDAGTYSVQIETNGAYQKSPMQATPLANIFATTFGYKECIQYPVGANVLCLSIGYDHCFIIGQVPDHDIGDPQSPARVFLKTADGNFDKQNRQGYVNSSVKRGTFNQNRPTDVVDGEYVVTNEFGVLLGLFQQLATLKASELAQVQCYLLDDLVRIISHNYEHLSAMGEFKISHDGRALFAEFGVTHDPREALGIPQINDNNKPAFIEDSPPTSGGTDEHDFYAFSADERTKAIERLRIFLGKMGDFVHMFISRPDPEAVRALNGVLGGKFDTGLADVHAGLDGRISVRTATGASIEKTNWIMVPHRVRTPEDPEGDDDVEFEVKDPFVFDNSKKYRNNPSLYFLQMRDCNAYLQDLYNYKNFLKYEKDFKLSKSPTNEETKLSEIDKVDPKTDVNLNDYQLRRSGIYLMDNGGVMIKDAWDSAIILEGGDIYLQAAKDLVSQPLRNYIAKAGQFVSIAAKKDVDISSTEEGFRLKTKKVQHLYSDEQGIVIQSNSTSDIEPSPADEAYDLFGGILLKSAKGIYQYGTKIFDRASERSLYKSKESVIETVKGGLTLKSDSSITVVPKDFNLFGTGSLNIIVQGSANVAGSSLNLGNEGTVIGMVPDGFFAHKGVIPVADFKETAETLMDIDWQSFFYPFQEDQKFEDVKFRFLNSSEYNLVEGEDHIPQSIAQQDDIAFNFLNLSAWEEVEINETLPFPGKDKFDGYYVTCDLQNLQKIDNDVFSKDCTSLQARSGQLAIESLQKYKVIG